LFTQPETIIAIAAGAGVLVGFAMCALGVLLGAAVKR